MFSGELLDDDRDRDRPLRAQNPCAPNWATVSQIRPGLTAVSAVVAV